MSAPGVPVPAKGPSRGKIIALVAVLVLLAGGGGLWWYLGSRSDIAEVDTGDCAIVDGSVRKVDCGSPFATHIVGQVLPPEVVAQGTCTDPYQDYDEAGVHLCLIPEMPEGICFDGTIDSFDVTPVRVDCSSDRAAKVIKVIQGKADESLCPRGANASVYPEPPLTQCIEPVKR
ncbi:hypothetical protein JOF56_010827 [Kibdelosporangium banguiense]|uniref:Uncharacterized protein n=1 Tax=Kibdelosporangium banguiense TaxID=1365924 RepID=A0ABS4U1B6_9PSEU|nr:hypothetical protein [Kibdelosporangium banguiense]MBP2330442.1 hypothetical protein [Kibdelosporangium banguiense]